MQLLRVEPFRGAQVASGVVVLVTLAALLELRMDWTAGEHLAASGVIGVFVWLLVVSTPPIPGRPTTWLSALCLSALGLLAVSQGRLAEVLGADGFYGAHATIAWAAAVLCVAAVLLARRRRSPACSLVAGIAGWVALAQAAQWALDASDTASRWIYLLSAIVLGLAAVATRDHEPEHAAQLANAGGAATLAIAVNSVVLLGVQEIGWGWELVLLTVGFGLVAYGTVESQRGPVVVGLANLAAFAVSAAFASSGEVDDVVGWPIALLAVAVPLLVIGLRPTTPAPPEPGESAAPIPLEARLRRSSGDDSDF